MKNNLKNFAYDTINGIICNTNWRIIRVSKSGIVKAVSDKYTNNSSECIIQINLSIETIDKGRVMFNHLCPIEDVAFRNDVLALLHLVEKHHKELASAFVALDLADHI